MRKFLVSALVTAAFAVAAPAQAQIVFNNSSRQDFLSNRASGNSPLAAITVSSPKLLNQIGVFWDPALSGNLKFLVFDLNTNALLFSTASTPFVDVGLSFYLSSVFPPYLLSTGVTYGIGAIADVAGGWGTNNSSSGVPFTQNGITADDDLNGNVSNFASPATQGGGSAMIIVSLGVQSSVVPEPGSIALLAAGLAGTAVVVRRRRRTA